MESGAWPTPVYVHMSKLERVCKYKCVHMCVCLCVMAFLCMCVCAYGMGRDGNTCLVSIFFPNKVLWYLTPGSLPKDASLGDCLCAHIVGSVHPNKAMMSLSHIVLRNHFHRPMMLRGNIAYGCHRYHDAWLHSNLIDKTRKGKLKP